MENLTQTYFGFNADPRPTQGKHVYTDRNYHTNSRIIERFLVDTIEESLASIDRCIELNKKLITE